MDAVSSVDDLPDFAHVFVDLRHNVDTLHGHIVQAAEFLQPDQHRELLAASAVLLGRMKLVERRVPDGPPSEGDVAELVACRDLAKTIIQGRDELMNKSNEALLRAQASKCPERAEENK